MKESSAYASIAWSKPFGQIVVTYHSGSVWAYPATAQEYAMMHRSNVSGGRFLNNTLKKRGGIELKAKPLKASSTRPVSAETAILSALFNQVTGLEYGGHLAAILN